MTFRWLPKRGHLHFCYPAAPLPLQSAGLAMPPRRASMMIWASRFRARLLASLRPPHAAGHAHAARRSMGPIARLPAALFDASSMASSRTYADAATTPVAMPRRRRRDDAAPDIRAAMGYPPHLGFL